MSWIDEDLIGDPLDRAGAQYDCYITLVREAEIAVLATINNDEPAEAQLNAPLLLEFELNS